MHIASKVLLVMCMVACSPKAELTISPRRACVGDPVRIAARTKGTRTLTATSLGIGPGTDTTRFQLIAVRHGDSAFAIVDILSYPRSGPDVTVYLQHAAASGNTVTWSDTLLADEWGDRLRIQTVANRSGVPMTIAHGGRTVLIDSGGAGSAAFGGLEISGSWEAVATVSPADAATHAELLVHLTCLPSGAAP